MMEDDFEDNLGLEPEQTTQKKLEDLQIDDDGGALSLDLSKKKKKKKKELVLEPTEAEPSEQEQPAESAGDGPKEGEGEEQITVDLDFNKDRRKKKKKVQRLFDDEMEDPEVAAEGDTGEDAAGPGKFPWSGVERDYTYEELVDRVFGILREKNPELTKGPRRTVLKPPQLAREGTKRTVFTNFMELCKSMNRSADHVSAYLLAELLVSGSMDGQQRLVLKGRFQPKNFEKVIRGYVNEYVLCQGCKSVDTLLDRDSATRLMHLRCQQCGASKTVSAIKSGFSARVSRRQQTQT